MLSNTQRTTLKKAAHKGASDIETLYRVIDESLIGHIAIVEDTGPVVIPMLAWRVGESLYIHGANNSRLMRNLSKGTKTCVTFTLFDGWVLARSAFHHSAHYRSAVVFGEFSQILDNQEKDRLLNHFIEQIAPGRTEEARLSNEKELNATMVLQLPLNEASVKISENNVSDDLADMEHPVWAGYIPYKTKIGPLIDANDLKAGIRKPDYRAAYGERWVEE